MIDLDELDRLANAASPGPWEYRETDGAAAVAYRDGWVEAILPAGAQENADAAYCACANPASILALTAEVRRLRAALSTPLLTGAYAPMYDGIFAAEGINQGVAESAFYAGAQTVTVYYGEKRTYTTMAAFCAAHPKEGV